VIDGVAVLRRLNQYVFAPYLSRRPWRYWRARRELQDARSFLDVIRTFRPEIVNWWSMYGLAKILLPLPRGAGIPDIHWIEQAWMPDEYGCDGSVASAFWGGVWRAKWAPRPLRPVVRPLTRVWRARVRRAGIPVGDFSNRPSHVCHVSRFMQQLHHARGCRFDSEEVIHGGVPTDKFLHRRPESTAGEGSLRALYVGQLTPDRGLHTVLDALARVPGSVRLTVAGDGPDEYVGSVRERAEVPDLAGRIDFLGRVPHDELPVVYQAHDVLVFASTRAEGLPLSIVEAMMAGCAVVMTASGGAAEIAEAAQIVPVPAGDVDALAERLRSLERDRDELRRCASRGQQAALAHFTLDQTIASYLAMLERVAGGPRRVSGVGSVARVS
jgi:glycosyltransferase involved in cell wall biosynthesis